MHSARRRKRTSEPLIELTAHERTIPTLLGRCAEQYADRPCLTIDESHVTHSDLLEVAASYAGLLDAGGVSQGDRVAIISENRFELLALFLGCAWRGAVFVPLNPASRGDGLEHMLGNADPRILVLESGLLDRLAGLESPAKIDRIWTLGSDGEENSPIAAIGEENSPIVARIEPFPEPRGPAPPTKVGPADIHAILYTSGTTGPSKGVMCPQAQFIHWGVNVGGWLSLDAGDTLYTSLPLFHTNALSTFIQALLFGAHVVVGPRFSASKFWQRMVESRATVTYLLGTMTSILAACDPSPLERSHRIRIALAPATSPEAWQIFEERFGIHVVDGHGMTETNAVIGPRGGEQRPGCMGRVMPGFEARVVDEQSRDAPDGEAGELVMRSEDPLAFASGYWRMPDATAAVWRNGWFHSGDRVLRDTDGYFRFLDRLKDSIRRRGENISGWEVEQVLLRHPNVEAAAAIPVPAELGEDEVMAVVVPCPGRDIDPEELVRFCEPLLAYFAIPRYVDIVDSLPLTESGKVRKVVLRERGVTEFTWDREAAGIELSR